jgi:hypothetical protein
MSVRLALGGRMVASLLKGAESEGVIEAGLRLLPAHPERPFIEASDYWGLAVRVGRAHSCRVAGDRGITPRTNRCNGHPLGRQTSHSPCTDHRRHE